MRQTGKPISEQMAKRIPKPWDENDESGELTQRLTAIELNKAGVKLSAKQGHEMTRSELLTERSALRRVTNDFAEKARVLNEKGDLAGAETALKIAEETSRIAGLYTSQLDLNDQTAAYVRDGKDGGQYRDSHGRAVRALGPNDRISDTLAYEGLQTDFGLGEYIAAMVRGTERPDIRAALSEGTDSAGGYTVPKRLMGDLFDRMRSSAVCVNAGAITIPLDTQQTTIARIASDPTAGWRLENAGVAESDPTFEAVTFNVRSLAVLVKVSRELLDDSLNIEQALNTAFAGALAVELDRVCLFGSGTAPEPRGIFNTTNVNSVSMGTNGAQLTNYAKMLDALYELELDNAAAPTAQIMHPRTSRTVRGFVDTTNQPLRAPQAIADIPALVTTTVPINQTQGSAVNASSIIVGDFAQLLIGLRQELRIEVLRETFAANMQYGFVAHLRADVAVAHPESFCKLIGVIP
jgi:HK97 family phage major capsid protein